MNKILKDLWMMLPIEINQAAYDRLQHLLTRCTINLAADLTGFTRQTFYRWLDTERSLEEMDYKQAAWFILQYETAPRIRMLLDRPPLSHPRLAKRVIEEGESNESA